MCTFQGKLQCKAENIEQRYQKSFMIETVD